MRFVTPFARCRMSVIALCIVVCCQASLCPAAEQNAGEQKSDQQQTDKPNFVLVMADDQGWGDVGYYGHPAIKTPVLDELAATALRFDRFYAAAPVCSPTRGSVMTGRHPNRFGCFKWGYPLRPQEITIAEALKTAGYTTGHFGKWHLGSMRAGSPTSPGGSGFDQWYSSPNFYENSPLLSHNGKVIETEGESSEVTADFAIEFIRDAVKDKRPFLAVVWFGNPHSPYVALDELKKLYPDQPANLQNYYGEITGIDRAVGKLRRELRELDIADNTLFWYTSDNGAQGPGSTGGLRGKKGSLWEGGIRVPAIIEWPAKIKQPRITNIPGNTFDIYPTLLDIAGVKLENQVEPIDGTSLLGVIEGSAKERGKPMGFWDFPESGQPKRSTQILQEQRRGQESGTLEEEKPDWKITRHYDEDVLPGHAAWMSGDWKLHRIAGKDGKNAQYQLYNLAKDREEKNDLAAAEPERVERMKAELEVWQKSVIRSLNGEDYTTALGADAGDKKSEKPASEPAEALVRRIKFGGLAPGRGRIGDPAVIEKSEQLAEAVKSEKAREEIEKQVDFSKETLLVFAWSGSGQDKLQAKTDDGKVVLQYRPGRTRDLRPHAALFAVKKGVEWKLTRPRGAR